MMQTLYREVLFLREVVQEGPLLDIAVTEVEPSRPQAFNEDEERLRSEQRV
jgi:hypothetical protein